MKDGESTVLRILTSPVIGWEDRATKEGFEYWTPIRTKEQNEPLNQVTDSYSSSGFKYPQEFRAMKIWNYETQQVQVWSTTRSTIKEVIIGFTKSKLLWSPLQYDIEVTKKGEKKETKYTIIAGSKEDLSPEITKAVESTPCNLEALITGGDPFEATF